MLQVSMRPHLVSPCMSYVHTRLYHDKGHNDDYPTDSSLSFVWSLRGAGGVCGGSQKAG